MRKRPAARLLVTDRAGRLLLFRFVHDSGPLAGRTYWATPGGALDEGETFEQAAKRELFEETRMDAAVGAVVGVRNVVFMLPDGEMVEAEERYFLVVTDGDADISANPDPVERAFIAEARWWKRDALLTTAETIYPGEIAAMLETALGARGYQSPSLMSGE